ncbi:16S rRNA (cytidine1402-2'-O)-methyltransferase [Nitratiruptor sp. YY08-26]|uniref:16S rRNA (cytidine(1402)-2'-O)-methyltransferase n=1 Tax=unclassified Nitratiruptor TaxID=2624044 RepID=UPI001916794B|nr:MULTISPECIES: 16S rRNA (cytidine(1402)-2'-O)-methyltransferase [unclassified Nitratiruptor]BCD62841.1 16S rRNA (cytidine1402-2'-O)-methyltransferase [Nitratiruptor sp. YY08-13]BCD66777.1 16S rRNA (cytidine1402-2'-O)-methyltransferase [Nitratiruptor sp. YY08-26]
MLTLVPTPIGNLEDITFRALRALEEADILLCEDTRVTKRLLHLLSQKYQRDFGAKEFIALHEHNQKSFLAKIDPSFFTRNVVYVSDAGMPGISDPGALLVQYAQEHGVLYDVLPGASAVVTAYAASGFEGGFCFFGFLPHKGNARKKALQEVLASQNNAVIYEAPHRLLKLLNEIAAIDPQRVLFLAKELTKSHQNFFKGQAQELARQIPQENVKGEWVVVVERGSKKREAITLSLEEILQLPLPKKDLAKLLAQVSDKSVKEWYTYLNEN